MNFQSGIMAREKLSDGMRRESILVDISVVALCELSNSNLEPNLTGWVNRLNITARETEAILLSPSAGSVYPPPSSIHDLVQA
jgi:hypothetical protein